MDGWVPGATSFRALKGSRKKKRSWRQVQDPTLGKCARTVRQRWRLESGRVTLRIIPKEGCLYRPKKVSVRVFSMADGVYSPEEGLTEFDRPIRDWLPETGFTRPVRYSRR